LTKERYFKRECDLFREELGLLKTLTLADHQRMAGKNWHSDTKSWSPVVKSETKDKARKARDLRKRGPSVVEIAKSLKLSKSRIYELLRDK